MYHIGNALKTSNTHEHDSHRDYLLLKVLITAVTLERIDYNELERISGDLVIFHQGMLAFYDIPWVLLKSHTFLDGILRTFHSQY